PDIVVARLRADQRLAVMPGEAAVEGAAGIGAVDGAPVALLELVAVDGVAQEIGDIVVEREVALDDVGAHPGFLAVVAPRPASRQAVALRVAAVGRVERAEAAD